MISMIFKGIDKEHEVLLRKLLEKINIKNSDEFIFEYEKGADLTVEKNGNKIKIIYANDSQLFRSLLLSAELISKNKDGKVTNQEIQAYGVESDLEKQKLADRNRVVSNMSMFYDVDDVDDSSLLDYRYLSDENS